MMGRRGDRWSGYLLLGIACDLFRGSFAASEPAIWDIPFCFCFYAFPDREIDEKDENRDFGLSVAYGEDLVSLAGLLGSLIWIHMNCMISRK